MVWYPLGSYEKPFGTVVLFFGEWECGTSQVNIKKNHFVLHAPGAEFWLLYSKRFIAKNWCQCLENLEKCVINGKSGCWFTGLNPALSIMSLNQTGWLWTCTKSREILEQEYTKRSGQKTGSLQGSVPPGMMWKAQMQLDWGASGSSGAIRPTRGRCWRPLSKQQSTATGMHICPLCHTASGCPMVRSTAASFLHWGGSAEDVRMSLLLLTRNTGPESHRKSHFPENIWQPIGGELWTYLFVLSMLLVFGNKDLIFQGC